MEKFTKHTKVKESNEETSKTLWENDYLKVIDAEGWTVVNEKDMVVSLPYLVEYGQVMFRLEDIPTFKLKYPAMDKFVTCLSGSIEVGESAKDALLREAEEEMGLVIKPEYEPELIKVLFASKGNTAQYHIYLMPLYEKDYYEVIPKGDGSKSEAKSKNAKIDVKYLNSINTNDLITTYLIDALKKHINML